MMKQIEKNILESNQLIVIAEEILREAEKEGAHQAEVGIVAHKGFDVTAHDGDVETIEYNQDKVIEIHVYFGKRSGSASISDIRPEAVREAVRAACHIAKFTDEDPAGGLASKDELAFHYPKLDLCYPWDITVEEAIKLACECEREAMAYDKRIMNAEAVSVSTAQALSIYANSNGFLGYFPHSRHEISCVLVAKEGDEMQRDYSYTAAIDPKDLQTISYIAKEAAEKTIRRLGARRIKTIKAPVIYVAEEARSLLGNFAGAISGGALYRKASFLLDHLGKQVFPSFVHIQEYPHLPRAFGSAPFDDNGVATRDNVFIADGILQNYALNVYSARKLNMKTTGNAGGMHNLTIHSGNKNLTELIKSMDKGLMITEMMGHGINLISGDYSRGAGGFWIEKGEIQYPVQEVTVAGKLQDMYMRITEVGNDVDKRGNIHTGSILLEEVMIAGD